MASAMRQTDFDSAPRLRNLNEDVAQSGDRFCIDVQSSHTIGNLGYLRRLHNNNRPSVIYFHGGLTKARRVSENLVESSKIILEENCSPNTQSTTSDEDDGSEYNNDKEEDVSEDLSPEKQAEENEDCRCRKRHRTSYNALQLKRLEEEFHGDNYIIGMKRWRLSEELSIPEKQIKIWFQNRRTKSKKDCNPTNDWS